MLVLQNKDEIFFEGAYKKNHVQSYEEKYNIKVNGRDCFINAARVSKMPFNRPWSGIQRPINQTEINGFISFAADEDVEIIVTSKEKINKAIIKPLSRKVKLKTGSNTVRFTLKQQGQYVLEINGQHEAIHIFFDGIKDYDKENATYCFGPGIHKCGIITLTDNDSLYIDRDAVVLASVFAKNAKNIHIFGEGILDGSTEERIGSTLLSVSGCYEGMTIGNIRMYNCENVIIDGVVLRDSATWAVSFFGCDNISINNIKLIGQWRYNTDGIDLTNTGNVTITNSFIRSFDDSISIKGVYNYEKYIENIKVNNCVIWCGWGKSCELGAETGAVGYRNITFENIDCIHNSIAAMDIQNCNDADIYDIYFKNINVEYPIDEPVKMLQADDDSVYIPQHTPEVCAFIKLDNRKTVYNFDWENGVYGKIHDIFFKNINAYVENTDLIKPIIHICSHDEKCLFTNILIENASINEKYADRPDFQIIEQNVRNIIFKSVHRKRLSI